MWRKAGSRLQESLDLWKFLSGGENFERGGRVSPPLDRALTKCAPPGKGARSRCHTVAMPEGLAWVQPEEQEQIARMRIALQDELAAALPELRHDHQFLRFLRGHGGFEKAVSRPPYLLLY